MFDLDTEESLTRLAAGAPFRQGGLECPVEIGDRWTFVPCANLDHSAGFADVLQVQATGTVVQIHEEHRWFRVAWEIQPGRVAWECFKF